ncbi:threonine dehydratase 1 biosynthetic, chloroplastic [Zea mays]|uniref:Threonine dehydratase n=2 Tax=Zea mays TaxID=4577 RepID=A0A1D6L203_MAIZE|nr:threonine dehydratase 1 biosynthetic, chloroplastic [Zea mays]ONM08541.1 Threonine dehydratase biosynthetic chloroplastic [Zea mays]ONM08542.1 Threonine dehydratase biosynthetic chloroplastic [Zea mays]|eukprot:XP_008665294.1 threonine dehydratase biosynthetic, chloroplastic [Zea mays]
MAAASTATAASHSASFPAASLRHDARRPSCVAPAAAAATTAAETGLTAVPAPPPTPMLRVVPESLQRDSGCLVAGFRERGAGAADGEGFGDAVGEGGGPGAMEYLTSVLSSKVYDVAIESPLQLATKLSDRLGVNLWIKREDLQPVFSFKLRGAYNMMAKLSREQLERGVICSSAGNHAQGVALSAQRLGCDAVIVMPVTTPEIKWKSVERLGATVVLEGDSYDEAQSYAKLRCQQEGRTFVPPFDHPDVITGQGTIGMEIVRQLQGPLHAIFVPVGGGGLIAGIAAYVKRVRPEVKIIGVEPSDANAMALSLCHGKRVMLEHVGGFADGVAVKAVGEETFRLCRELVDGIVMVSRDAICASIKDMFEEKRSILEPAGALALAGAEAYCKYYNLKGETVVAITSGANMNFDRLRLVTELADVGRKREAVLATFLPERQGSFKKFTELVGRMNITEFKYRYDSNAKDALVLYSVGIYTDNELGAMMDRMESAKLRTVNLTDNDLAKDHLRYFIGGRSEIKDELVYRFIFPERPGALMKFLDTFSPRWNISLFHYRAQGEAGANVLVGIQVPPAEFDEFKSHANNLGYEYMSEHNNEIYRLLLRDPKV